MSIPSKIPYKIPLLRKMKCFFSNDTQKKMNMENIQMPVKFENT